MSNFSGYKTKAFSPTQKFFVLDPNTGSPSFVQGSDLVSQLTPNSNYVYAESTRTNAQATDYALGSVIQTGGATSVGDNEAGVYLVVPSGEGDFPMDNGNELLELAGDDTLREQLALNSEGDGSDLVAHTGTANTVTETLDEHTDEIAQRTIYVGSVAESFAGLSPAAGVLYRAIAWHEKSGAFAFADPTTRGGGLFVYDAARLKSDHDGVTVFSPTVPAVSAQAGTSLQARTENYGNGAGETAPTGAGVLVRLSEKDHLTFHDAGVLESFADCTARANAAILAAVNGPGKLYADEGTYNFTGAGSSADGMKLPSGAATQALEFYGAGIDKTIIHQDASARFVLSCNTSPTESGPNPDTDNSRNIKIHDMTFEGEVAAAGFNPQFHFLSLNAVSDVEIFRTAFIGFRGDGVYLGSSQTADIERHNQNVIIHHCIFDGVNNDNRNGISIIDGSAVTIHNNKFIRCTRADMPGPIDVEPDLSVFALIKDIDVNNNEFDTCGGVAIFQVYLPNGLDYTVPAQNIRFTKNWIKANCLTAGLSASGSKWCSVVIDSAVSPKLITSADPDNNIEISGNFVFPLGALVIHGAKTVNIEDNFLIHTGPTVIGAVDRSNERNSIGVTYKNNYHSEAGNSVGTLLIGMSEAVDVKGNRFARPVNNQAIAIFADAGVTGVVSDDITIDGNVYGNGYVTDIFNQNNTATNVFIGSERTESGDLIAISSALTYTNLSALELVKSYDTAKLPDSFPLGESISVVNGDTGAPDASNQGMLRTTKPNAGTGFRKFAQQWYYPANNSATTLAEVYWRKGADASNAWTGWIRVTGTVV